MKNNNTKIRNDDSIQDFVGDIDIKKEYKATLEIFSGNLVNFLEAESEIVIDIIEDYNDILIILLSSIKNSKKEIERSLYQNFEKLTHKTFAIKKKPHAPSVRNWLRDFIAVNGSGKFDNVRMSQYITNSSNAKRLNKDEQKLVTKLLILYRNIKFFPESMPNDTGEGWEIIPLEDSEENKFDTRSVLGPPRTTAEKEIDELKKEEERYATGGIERMAIEEEIEEESKIEDLKIEAKKYKEGSLEKKALLEEVGKMEGRVVLKK